MLLTALFSALLTLGLSLLATAIAVFSPTVGLSLLATAIAVFSTTVYLHRAATHGALVLHPLALFAFKFATWLTTGIRPWEWVAVHRKHHRFSDVDGDPHSPYLAGFWQIQVGNVFWYAREARNSETVRAFAGDILAARTWLDRRVFAHGTIGVLLGLALLCWFLGPLRGLIAGAIHLFLYVFVLSSSVNGLCHSRHLIGYQNYPGQHVVTVFNNWLVAIFTAGEGFHQNHHWKQSLARFGHRWFEVDFGWWMIWILEKMKLVTKVVRFRPVYAR